MSLFFKDSRRGLSVQLPFFVASIVHTIQVNMMGGAWRGVSKVTGANINRIIGDHGPGGELKI